jgi:hypothetical protein
MTSPPSRHGIGSVAASGFPLQAHLRHTRISTPALYCRKTVGEITGSITVNGHPKEQATFARVMGYCEQVCKDDHKEERGGWRVVFFGFSWTLLLMP